jgi:hypothetical protein
MTIAGSAGRQQENCHAADDGPGRGCRDYRQRFFLGSIHPMTGMSFATYARYSYESDEMHR